MYCAGPALCFVKGREGMGSTFLSVNTFGDG